MKGLYLGYLTGVSLLLYLTSLIIAIPKLLGFGAETQNMLFVLSIPVFGLSIYLAIKTGQIVNRVTNGSASHKDEYWHSKIKRFFLAYLFTCIAVVVLRLVFPETAKHIDSLNHGDVMGKQAYVQFVFFSIVGLLTLGVPVFYKIVAFVINSVERLSGTVKESWFLDKIVAPVITSAITGFIGKYITDEFHFGFSISLISIPIAWILNLKVSVEADI